MAKNRVLYASPWLADLVVKFACIRALMMKNQCCIVLMVIRDYRTVCGTAALILAGTVPPNLVTLERRAIHELGRKLETEQRTRNDSGRSYKGMAEKVGGRRLRGRMDKEDFPKYF